MIPLNLFSLVISVSSCILVSVNDHDGTACDYEASHVEASEPEVGFDLLRSQLLISHYKYPIYYVI